MGNYFDDDQTVQSLKRIGYMLVVGYFFPLYFGGLIGGLIFFNIELLGKVPFMMNLALLSPLIGGSSILGAARKLSDRNRGLTVFIVGVVSLLLLGTFSSGRGMYASQFIPTGTMGDYLLGCLMILAIIGVYVGSRLVSLTDHIAGRLLGGISGIVFMALMLLPIKGTPTYFNLFTVFKSSGYGGLPFAVLLLGIGLIAIFSAFLFSSLVAVLNISERPTASQTAENAQRIVFFAGLALPALLLLTVLLIPGSACGSFTGKTLLFTLIIKFSLWFGGIFAAMALGLLDMVDAMIPKTSKGGSLFTKTQPQGGQPLNVYPGYPNYHQPSPNNNHSYRAPGESPGGTLYQGPGSDSPGGTLYQGPANDLPGNPISRDSYPQKRSPQPGTVNPGSNYGSYNRRDNSRDNHRDYKPGVPGRPIQPAPNQNTPKKSDPDSQLFLDFPEFDDR